MTADHVEPISDDLCPDDEMVEFAEKLASDALSSFLTEEEARQSNYLLAQFIGTYLRRMAARISEQSKEIERLQKLAAHEHEVAAARLKRLLGSDGDSEPVREVLDMVVGWCSPQNAVQCDCHTKSPTWPIARDQYHLEPCPWFYVQEFGNAYLHQEQEIERLQDEIKRLSEPGEVQWDADAGGYVKS